MIEIQILGKDRGVGVLCLPGAPGGDRNRCLRQNDTSIGQRARDSVAEEGVEDALAVQVIHHLVGPAQQTTGPKNRSIETFDFVGEEHLGRSAQGAVGHAEVPSAQCVVHHFPDLHDVLWIRPSLTVDLHAKDDSFVGVPIASGGVGRGGIVGRWDTAARAAFGIAKGPGIDEDPTPADETPINVARLIKERLPVGLNQGEQPLLGFEVARRFGDVPSDEAVGVLLPVVARDQLEAGHLVGIARHSRAGVFAKDETEEVTEHPSQTHITGLSENIESLAFVDVENPIVQRWAINLFDGRYHLI